MHYEFQDIIHLNFFLCDIISTTLSEFADRVGTPPGRYLSFHETEEEALSAFVQDIHKVAQGFEAKNALLEDFYLEEPDEETLTQCVKTADVLFQEGLLIFKNILEDLSLTGEA